MAGMSDYLEVAINNAIFNAIPFSVSQVYVSLHTGDPGDASGVNEITDSGYLRKAASFGTPESATGICKNDLEVVFNALADVATVNITHFGLWSAASGGNYLGSGAVAVPKNFTQNDVPRFPINSLVSTLS